MGQHSRILDIEKLYLAVDEQRRERCISWRQVGREIGGAGDDSTSWITRLAHGKSRGQSINSDKLLALLIWLGHENLRALTVDGV